MLIETLVTAFVAGFAAIAVLGHVLLLQAAFRPASDRNSTQAGERPSRHAPVAGMRIAA